MKKKTETKMKEETKIVGAGCDDEKCHIHGKVKARGRIFEGTVTKKVPTRVVIEFERMVYNKKYERYFRSKTKIHAHLSKCMENEIKVGDLIWVQECRPLSKIIHFVVIKKIKSGDEK